MLTSGTSGIGGEEAPEGGLTWLELGSGLEPEGDPTPPDPPTTQAIPVTVREPTSAPEEPELDLRSRDHVG